MPFPHILKNQKRHKSFSTMSGCAALSAIAGSSSFGNENVVLPSNRLGLRSHEFRKTICLGFVYGFVRIRRGSNK